MSVRHALLRRQLRRLELSEDAPPTLAAWTALLDRVAQVYVDSDEDRYTTERAFQIASREVQELHERLQARSADALAVERDKLSSSVLLLSATMESITDALLVIDSGRRVVTYNRRFVDLWRVPADALASGEDRLLIAAVVSKLRAPSEFLAKIDHLYEHPEETSSDELGLVDGRIIDRYSAPVLDPAGRIQARVWRFRDVTAQRRAELELREAKETAERASQAKTDFLANMSHELRTPLNAIVGFARLLSVAPAGTSEAAHHEYLAYVLGASEHMLSLVNDLLDLRRVEAGRDFLDLGEHVVGPLAEAAARMVQPLFAARRQRFADLGHVALPSVCCDARALVQVLTNLLSNAAKYTPEGGVIELSSWSTPHAVWLAVRDEGIGIDPEDQARLFTYFTQVGAKHAHHMHGSGVGLALARELVQRMGGQIEVESARGRGSTFRFSLPRAGGER